MTSFALKPGVSFCETAGRILFLDIVANRYFGLSLDAESSFRRLAAAEPLDTADAIRLRAMAQSGLLAAADADLRPRACPPQPKPFHSLVDRQEHPRAGAVAGALARLTASSLALRARPLAAVLARLERRKSVASRAPGDAESVMGEVAAAFRRSMLIASPLDQCLPRSLAAAHRLLDHGVSADLVIGVRLRPFAAHCWVQRGPVLVNETIDQVRTFTPILIV